MTESQLPTVLLTIAPLHMGAMHPMEQLLVLGVAFGPFLVLFVVVYVARRRAIDEEQEQDREETGG